MSTESALTHGSTIDPDLEIAIKAAIAAGDIISDRAGRIHNIESKGVGDLVSEVDTQADVAITAVLQQHSDLAILCEESSPTLARRRG